MRYVLALGVVALLAAGCGARSNTPFTAKGTAPCVRQKGFTGVSTSAAKVGFIAAVSANGGLTGRSPNGNVVTIAFTASSDAVGSTEQAFRVHAPAALRPHISDVMRTSRNAVIVWTTTPSSADESAVEGCLAS